MCVRLRGSASVGVCEIEGQCECRCVCFEFVCTSLLAHNAHQYHDHEHLAPILSHITTLLPALSLISSESTNALNSRDEENSALYEEALSLRRELAEAQRAKAYYSACYYKVQGELDDARSVRAALEETVLGACCVCVVLDLPLRM